MAGSGWKLKVPGIPSTISTCSLGPVESSPAGIYSRFTLLLPTTFLLIYKETADLTVASAFV